MSDVPRRRDLVALEPAAARTELVAAARRAGFEIEQHAASLVLRVTHEAVTPRSHVSMVLRITPEGEGARIQPEVRVDPRWLQVGGALALAFALVLLVDAPFLKQLVLAAAAFVTAASWPAWGMLRDADDARALRAFADSIVPSLAD